MLLGIRDFGLGLVNTFLYYRFFDVCFEVLHITVINEILSQKQAYIFIGTSYDMIVPCILKKTHKNGVAEESRER